MNNVCRTCLKVSDDGSSYVSLDTVFESNHPSLRNKLSVCVPELEHDSNEAVICLLCMDALNTSYSFKSRCLQTEEVIINFARKIGCDTNSVDVLHVACYNESELNSKQEIEVTPIVFGGTEPLARQIKQEFEIKQEPEPQPFGLSNFETETNVLINSIPFNPELDVKIRDSAGFLNTFPSTANHLSVKTPPFYCVYCHISFDNRSEYVAHLAKHAMENRPLKCEMCEKRFVRKDKLMLHMRIHTGEKPFKCTVCQKCFSRKDKLNNHIRTHTGEKPHQCILCQKCFARKDKMNLHMKSQHFTALSNLEITIVKYGPNGVIPKMATENIPKIK